MDLTTLFLEQLERESRGSRRALESVPTDRPDWKPHDRSMALGYLTTLVATMPSWLEMTVEQDFLDLAPPEGSGYQPPGWSTTAELLAVHEQAVAGARRALTATGEAHLATSWQLRVGGQVVMEQPRYVVLGDTFCHLAHHRGQLTVYMRLLGAPVPAIYGPSADDNSFG